MPIVLMPDGVEVEFPDDMASEQIRSMIESKFPNAPQIANQQQPIYDADRDVVLSAPASAKPDEIRYYDGVQNLSESKADYYGFNKIEMPRQSSFYDNAMDVLALPTADIVLQTNRAVTFGARYLRELGIVDEAAISGFIDKMTKGNERLNQSVIEKRQKAGGGFGTDVYVGLTQLPYYAAMGSAKGAAVIYSLIGSSNGERIYQEAVQKNPENENALAQASGIGFTSAAVEAALGHVFFKNVMPKVGERFVSHVAKVAVIGGAEEAGASLTEDVGTIATDIRDKDAGEVIKDALYSFAVGSFVGTGAASVAQIPNIKQKLAAAGVKNTDDVIEAIKSEGEKFGAEIEKVINDDIDVLNRDPSQIDAADKAIKNIATQDYAAMADDMSSLGFSEEQIRSTIANVKMIAADTTSISKIKSDGAAQESAIIAEQKRNEIFLDIKKKYPAADAKEIEVSGAKDSSPYMLPSGEIVLAPMDGHNELAVSAGYKDSVDFLKTGALRFNLDDKTLIVSGNKSVGLTPRQRSFITKAAKGREVVFDIFDSNNMSIASGNNIKEFLLQMPNQSLAIGDAVKSLNVNEKRLASYESMLANKKTFTGEAKQKILDDLDSLRVGTEKLLTPISSRVTRISEKIGAKFNLFEGKYHTKLAKRSQVTNEFLDLWSKLSSVDMASLDFAMKNGWKDDIKSILSKYTRKDVVSKIDKLLVEIADDADSVGMEIGRVENYYPRAVKDHAGLLRYLKGSEAWSELERAIAAVAERKGRKALSQEEQAEIATRFLQGRRVMGVDMSLPKNAKQRVLSEIDGKSASYYHDSAQALARYVIDMKSNIEQRKFFGESRKEAPDEVENLVADFMLREIAAGNINPNQEQELSDIFKARFSKHGMAPWTQFFRNSQYILTMGQFKSAVTQLQDVYTSLYNNGFYRTGATILDIAARKKLITREDLGINPISAEFLSNGISAKAVDLVFKLNFLTAMDAFGKKTFINSTFRKLQDYANPKSKAHGALKAQLDLIFEGEADSVLSDIQKGLATDNVKAFLFIELSRMQPISLSQMPEMWLNNPNGRVFYMLKTFTIRHLDMVRTEVFDQYKTNPKQAAKNLTTLLSLFVIMGMTADELKNFMLGRDAEPSDMFVDNLLKFVGFNKFTLDRATSGRVSGDDVIKDFIAPPIIMPDDAKEIPLFGDLYWWWFGGRESKNKKEPETFDDIFNK
jgi:hypothetical protein